jgi:hypothetical protein
MGVTTYYSVGGEIFGERTGAVRRDYLRDALGSVTATKVTTEPVVENTYRYKPYGAQLSKTGASPDPKFQWVGTAGYRQTSISHSASSVRARHYGQEEGRWTTVDPLWPAEPALSYSNSSPTVSIDPYGLQWGAPVTTPVAPQLPPVKTPCPAPAVLARVCIIAGGIWACYEICTYELGAPSGPLTQLGECFGKSIFPGPDELPPETPQCPKPPKPRSQAEARRIALLQRYGKCQRIHNGKVRPAKVCPGGGTHQTDIYICRDKKVTEKVAASVVCCICIDIFGVSEYCFASVHGALK